MKLDRTRSLIQEGVDQADPKAALVQVLESAIKLIEIPNNDFSWSSWQTVKDAKMELLGLIGRLKKGDIPDKLDVAVIFAPTGPLQEVSLNSGWGRSFLSVAKRFDEVERQLWNRQG